MWDGHGAVRLQAACDLGHSSVLLLERLSADPAGLTRRMAALLNLDPGRLQLWLFARCVQESIDDPALLEVATRIAP